MLLKIILVFAAAWLILAYISNKQHIDEMMAKSPSAVFAEIGNPLHEPFNIEKERLKLQEEREKQEPYLITLWWGFDGLRLNPDGSTEWIRRSILEETKNPTKRKPHHFSVIPAEVFEMIEEEHARTKTKDTVENKLEILIQDAHLQLLESGFKDSRAVNELAALYRMKLNLQSLNAAKTQYKSVVQSACADQFIQAQIQSATVCQNTTLQNALYAQCQNVALPSYLLYNSPYTPYWTYSVGGNFGIYKS